MVDSRYSYQNINITLESEIVNRRYPLAGQRITHNEGTQKITIKLGSNTNDEIDIQPQGSIRVPDGFTQFFVSADASPGNSIELIVSSPANMEFDNKALTVDVVDTITTLETADQITVNRLLERDASLYYETLAGNTFIKGYRNTGAGSTYNHMQLINPASSGKIVIVKSILASTLNAGSTDRIGLLYYDSNLSSDIGAGLNKRPGNDNGIAHLRHENNASVLGTQITDFKVLHYDMAQLIQSDYIVLDEGKGILVSRLIIDGNLSVVYEWEEQST